MITKHTIYVLTCDECGRTYSQHEDDGYMTWHYSRKDVVDNAILDDWVLTKKGLSKGYFHFCPQCVEKLRLREMEAENE